MFLVHTGIVQDLIIAHIMAGSFKDVGRMAAKGKMSEKQLTEWAQHHLKLRDAPKITYIYRILRSFKCIISLLQILGHLKKIVLPPHHRLKRSLTYGFANKMRTKG